MKVIENHDINEVLWNDLIQKCLFASPFQTPSFLKFFNSLNRIHAFVYAIEKNNSYVALVVITIQKEKGLKGYFSKRGIIYGGPLFLEDYKTECEFLLKHVIQKHTSDTIYIETRNAFDYSIFKAIFHNIGFRYIPWLNYIVDCTDIASVKKSMSSSKFRQIKKASAAGATYHEAKSINEVKDFYKILEILYLKKIKKPLFPEEFFLNFYEQNIGKYFLVYFENKVIGGIMCPIFEKKAIYELYVCGLDREYKELYPSSLATWAAIEFACQNNIPIFDFMGAGSPEEEYGVREFKSRFGGQLVEFGRFIYISKPFLYNLGKKLLKLKSKLF